MPLTRRQTKSVQRGTDGMRAQRAARFNTTGSEDRRGAQPSGGERFGRTFWNGDDGAGGRRAQEGNGSRGAGVGKTNGHAGRKCRACHACSTRGTTRVARRIVRGQHAGCRAGVAGRGGRCRRKRVVLMRRRQRGRVAVAHHCVRHARERGVARPGFGSRGTWRTRCTWRAMRAQRGHCLQRHGHAQQPQHEEFAPTIHAAQSSTARAPLANWPVPVSASARRAGNTVLRGLTARTGGMPRSGCVAARARRD